MHPINTWSGKYSCEVQILDRGISQLKRMLEHHCKVLCIRVDLHLNQYEERNDRISRLMRKLRKWVKREFKMKRMGYLWVREKEKAKHQHYHLYLFLDGNKIQTSYKILAWITEEWTSQDQPKPPRIENPYLNIRRGDKQALDEVIERLSYLAKTRCKRYRKRYVKDYSTSRIKGCD